MASHSRRISKDRTPDSVPGALAGVDLRPIACLLLLTLPWWMAVTCGFIHIDDPTYVLQNPNVLAGLTGKSVAWAFTSVSPSYWCPLTWLSLMLDVSVWGAGVAHPEGFHATNVLLHIANVVLVYLLLQALTRQTGRSLLVAALFAMHPLRVESVAWITERKDVLAVFFGLLALAAYVRHVRAPGAGRFLLVMAFYALSLMAKPLFVTLPLLLLVLDYWPLGRTSQVRLGQLLLEKVPFLGLAFAVGLLTYALVIAWPPADAARTVIPLALRLENAVVMLALSLRDTFYFLQLSIYYPQVQTILPAQLVGSALLLLALVCMVVGLHRKSPERGRPLVMGLLWFFIAMLPVLNIAQAGDQSRADRFSYLPCIGLFAGLVFAWPSSWLGGLRGSKVRVALAVATVLTLAVFTTLRLDLWRDPLALYLEGIAHTGDNAYLEHWAASAYQELGGRATTRAAREAAYRQEMLHAQRALELHPVAFEHNNVGVALAHNGRLPEALEQFRLAHELRPGDRALEANYVNTLAELRRRGILAPASAP